MKSSVILAAAFAGAAMAAGVTNVGCYKSSNGVTMNGTDDWMSLGKCAGFCPDSPAFATQYKTCYCGDEIPADSDKVDDSKCNTPCPGFPANNCGGSGLFFFYNSGIETTLKKYGASDSSSDSANPSQTASAKPSVITLAGQTVTATAAGQSSAAASKQSGGTNKAGIAAGVVVGVVALSAIAGGIFMFMRNRKRRAIEEEHRRNAALNNYINGKPPMSSAGSSSFTDTRLDPVMAQRRMSDGSIADNEDYSRRILKVTNA